MLTSRIDEDVHLSKLISQGIIIIFLRCRLPPFTPLIPPKNSHITVFTFTAEKNKDKESNFLKRLTGLTENDPSAEAISDALRKKGEYTKEAVVRLLETIEAWLAKKERFFSDLAVEKGA